MSQGATAAKERAIREPGRRSGFHRSRHPRVRRYQRHDAPISTIIIISGNSS
jgi:hypothetical protein